MLLRNTASQNMSASVIDTDAEAATTGVDFFITKDNGTRTAAGGSASHKGGGQWNYAPSQAETDAEHVVLSWSGTDIVPGSREYRPLDLADFLGDVAAEMPWDTVAFELVSEGVATEGSASTAADSAFAVEQIMTGITSLAQWLGLLAGKQTGNSTARTELRATGAGSGGYDETTDSQEAIRDTAPLGTAMRGTDDASTHEAADVWAHGSRTLSANAITAFTIADNAITADKVTQGVLDKVWDTTTRTLSEISNAIIDAIWNRLRSADTRPEGSFGEFLDAKVSEVEGGEGGGGDSNWSNEQRDAVLGRTARVDALIEDVGGDRFTAKSLEQAPTGEGTVGAGSVQHTLTITDAGDDPIDGVEVWITTSDASSSTGVVAGTRHTDAMGEVTFMLDPGTYYRWAQKSGVNFDNPQEFEVTA